MKQIKIIRTIGKLTNFLEANGISIEESEDFSGFEKLAKKVRGKKASGQFRLRNFDFNAENAFWIKFIYDGQPVSVQAGRLDNLGKDTLAHYWNNQQGRVYPKPNKVGGKHCPLAEEITGKVIFGGEFSIRHDLRKKGFSGPMIFLGLLLAFNRWQHADWIYGLMNEDLALVGFDHRQGFLRCNPRGFHWEDEPDGISTDDWLVTMSQADVEWWCEIIAGERGLRSILPPKIKENPGVS